MAKQKSYKGKKQYATYKTENRAYRNKVAKLERHVKEHPDDETGKKNLERLQKNPSSYKMRSRPNAPGSNRPFVITTSYRTEPVELPKTPGEQLSELLGIPLPKYVRRTHKGKTPVTVKKKKDVKTKKVS